MNGHKFVPTRYYYSLRTLVLHSQYSTASSVEQEGSTSNVYVESIFQIVVIGFFIFDYSHFSSSDLSFLGGGWHYLGLHPSGHILDVSQASPRNVGTCPRYVQHMAGTWPGHRRDREGQHGPSFLDIGLSIGNSRV